MTLAGSTSRSLLARVRAAEEDAWERVVDLYAPLVMHWLRQARLSDADAADVFQDTFQAVATHIERFRSERPGDSFRGWLRTITRNKVIDHVRRRGREPIGAGGSSVQRRLNELALPETEPASDAPAVRGLLLRALDGVRPHFRERTWLAFWRTAVEGRPHADVAEELGLSPGALRVAKSRVLQRLRAELGELDDLLEEEL